MMYHNSFTNMLYIIFLFPYIHVARMVGKEGGRGAGDGRVGLVQRKNIKGQLSWRSSDNEQSTETK